MRLSPTEIKTIRQVAQQNFGTDVSIWLFGSRVDDTQRGGDVDLYMEPTQENTFLSELICKVTIEDKLDLQVDLVVKNHRMDKSIYHLAKAQGVRL